MECNYDDSESTYLKYNQLISNLYCAIVNYQENKVIQINNNFNKDKKRIENSIAYPFYLQAKTQQLIYGTIQENTLLEIKENLLIMLELSSCMDNLYLLRYYELKLLLDEKIFTFDNLKQDIFEVNEILRNVITKSDDELYHLVLINYRLAKASRKINANTECIHYCNQAIFQLTELCSFNRIPDLLMIKANAYAQSNQMNKAINIYERLIKNQANNIEPYIRNQALNNLSWFYMTSNTITLKLLASG